MVKCVVASRGGSGPKTPKVTSTKRRRMSTDIGLMSTDNALMSMDNGLMSTDNWPMARTTG